MCDLMVSGFGVELFQVSRLYGASKIILNGLVGRTECPKTPGLFQHCRQLLVSFLLPASCPDPSPHLLQDRSSFHLACPCPNLVHSLETCFGLNGVQFLWLAFVCIKFGDGGGREKNWNIYPYCPIGNGLSEILGAGISQTRTHILDLWKKNYVFHITALTRNVNRTEPMEFLCVYWCLKYILIDDNKEKHSLKNVFPSSYNRGYGMAGWGLGLGFRELLVWECTPLLWHHL